MKKYICEPCGYEYDPEIVIQITESHLEQHSKIFQKIGYAHSAVLVKMFL